MEFHLCPGCFIEEHPGAVVYDVIIEDYCNLHLLQVSGRFKELLATEGIRSKWYPGDKQVMDLLSRETAKRGV